MSGVEVIRALLVGNDDLVAMVDPERIICDDLPLNSPLPAISIMLAGGNVRKVLKAGSKRRVNERVEVNVYARDPDERIDVHTLVKNAAADAIGDFAGVTEVSVQLDDPGLDVTGENSVRIRMQDFMVSYNEPTGPHAAPVYDPDALALWARRTVAPTDQEKAWDNELIVGLKADGIWSKLDLLKIRAQRDEQAARLDYIDARWNDVAVNSPTFLKGQGWIGDMVAAYLDSGFDPGAQPTAKFKGPDSLLGVYLGTDLSSGTQFDVGHSRALIVGRFGANAQVRANQTAGVNIPLPVLTSIGWFCWTRRDASGFWAVKDDSAPVYTAQAAAGIAISQTMLSLAARTNAGAPSNFSGRLQLAMVAGGSLSDLELVQLRARIKRRLEQAGAI